jgi:tRNA threonylcarbamoyl adenosine modification protein YeaZ
MTSYRLMIDTSIFGAAVGIGMIGNERIDYVEVSENIADSASQLPGMVERSLAKVGASFGSLQEIVVSRGPGSFTGIRVGLAYALGLKSGLTSNLGGTRLAGVSSMLILASSEAQKRAKAVALYLPSTKTTGYLALSDGNATDILAIDILGTSWSKLNLGVKVQNADQISIGPWACLSDPVFARPEDNLEVWQPRVAASNAVVEMGRIAASWTDRDWQAQETSPLYLRKSTVEEKALLGVQVRQ